MRGRGEEARGDATVGLEGRTKRIELKFEMVSAGKGNGKSKDNGAVCWRKGRRIQGLVVMRTIYESKGSERWGTTAALAARRGKAKTRGQGRRIVSRTQLEQEVQAKINDQQAAKARYHQGG